MNGSYRKSRIGAALARKAAECADVPGSAKLTPDRHLKLLDAPRAQFLWAMTNIALALLCRVLATTAFGYGHIVAGLLTLVISVALVVNSDAHKKRGDRFAREAEAGSKP